MNAKRVLVFAGKLGYQTRSFGEAARKLGFELAFVTDRCHQLEDPWADGAIAVHFESPEAAAYTVLETARNGKHVDGILVLGRSASRSGGLRSARVGAGLQSSGGGGSLPK